MRRLARYLGRYRLRLAWGIACLIAATTLAMSIPELWKLTLNAIAHDGGTRRVGWLVAAIIGIALAQGVARTFSRYVLFNVGRDVEYDLRNDLFAHLERLPLGFYQERQTGDLMSRLVNDVNAVRMMLGPGLLTFINTPIYYAYGLFFMMRLDWQVTLAALAVYPLTLGVVKRTSRLLMERTLRVQEGLAELSARTQENLAGIHVVKAYACEAREVEDFRERNGRFQVTNMRLAEVRSLIGPVMNVVGGVSTLVVLWMGGTRIMAGTMSVGDIAAFIGYLYLLAWPTMALGWMLSVLQRGRAAMQRLEEVFAVEPAIDSPPGATAPDEIRGELCFRDVTFRYGRSATSAPTLDGVSVTVPAGKTVAIVGRTGAGKTALVQLAARLFDVERGSVLLDGRDVRTLPLGWLRRQVGLVPQDPFLFSRTIRENVAFALDDASDERVVWAVEAAGLASDVASMPEGLDTVVGERGVTLSGGQKQRTTLARVVAASPRVLILDDALSSVDTETERRILEHLHDFLRERTTIVVAHRLTTVQDADLIVVLDDGRVVEIGDHAALMARGGLYADLFEQQVLEGELEAV